MPSDEFAATEELVKARLQQLNCVLKGRTITAHLYETADGKAFHVPLPFIAEVGYSINQLNFIEQQLARIGIDFLPLDYNLLN